MFVVEFIMNFIYLNGTNSWTDNVSTSHSHVYYKSNDIEMCPLSHNRLKDLCTFDFVNNGGSSTNPLKLTPWPRY